MKFPPPHTSPRYMTFGAIKGFEQNLYRVWCEENLTAAEREDPELALKKLGIPPVEKFGDLVGPESTTGDWRFGRPFEDRDMLIVYATSGTRPPQLYLNPRVFNPPNRFSKGGKLEENLEPEEMAAREKGKESFFDDVVPELTMIV